MARTRSPEVRSHSPSGENDAGPADFRLEQGHRKGCSGLRTPIFTHTYDYATPRNSGAGRNIGWWLFPALTLHRIPPQGLERTRRRHHQKLSDIMIGMGQQ
jgi:hypothetical protein